MIEESKPKEMEEKKPWITPKLLSTFTEEQLVQQKEALTFLGDWLQITWGQS